MEITCNTPPQITCNIHPQIIQSADNKRILMCHQKEGEIIFGVEIPNIGYTYSIGITKIFLKQKRRLLQELFLHLNPYRHQTLLF